MFRNVDHALRWAALVRNSVIIDKPSINQMRGRDVGNPNEILINLSPQERQIQAAKIYQYAHDISDKAESDYIKARYFYEPKYEELMMRVLSGLLYSGGVYRRGIQSIVLEYIGIKEVTHRDLREQLHCGNDKVRSYRNQVYDVLDKIHARALDSVDSKLIESGLIEDYRAAV